MGVVVETKELVQTVVASLIAGVGVTVVFSVAIWGAPRFVDLSVALGIVVMTSK